jgi:hypothetical protein
MAYKTIGQISSASSAALTDLMEIESGGVSYQITLAQLAGLAIPCGKIEDFAYEKTISASFPAVAIWDADKTINAANYPVLVPELRAAASFVTVTSGSNITSININMTAGSTITSVDSAFTIMLAALTEEYALQSTYSICVTIGGTDYAIASISSVIGITGAIATGATTMTVYPHRIVGSTSTAKIFKDSGRALMSVDGKLRIAGLRRRFHMQGHWHNIYGAGGTGQVGGVAQVFSTGSNGTISAAGDICRDPKTDGTNGTPITGPETEPNSSTVYRYIWAQIYIP